MDTQDIIVWYVVILTGSAIIMAWATWRTNARALAVDEGLTRLIASLEIVREDLRRLEAAAETSFEPRVDSLPASAVLEIRETYEEIVRLQRRQYEARISDLTTIYDEQVRYLRTELTSARSQSGTDSEPVAMNEQHLELIDLVKKLIAGLDV